MSNNNPILDTCEYIIEFMDGHEETMTANLIAEYTLDNIEQSHLLEDPDLRKEFHKSLSSEDIPEADEDDNLEGTKCEEYNQKPTPDTIGDTYLSAELANQDMDMNILNIQG